MKNILLLVHDDAGQEARFQAALDITRAIEGHLVCVDVARIPMIAGGDFYGAPAGATVFSAELDNEADNRVRLEARLTHEGVSWDWVDLSGDLAECVIGAAGLADIIVVNRKLDAATAPDMRGVAGAVLVRTRTPVVAVPDSLDRFELNGRALIAWDGSTPVMATMRACVPILGLASAVEIFTVEDGGEIASAEEAAAYLSRHGIHASIKRLNDRSHAIDALIAKECADWQADWCLMGAYGQGRLTEALFGGVTRRLLGNSRIPLVLGH